MPPVKHKTDSHDQKYFKLELLNYSTVHHPDGKQCFSRKPAPTHWRTEDSDVPPQILSNQRYCNHHITDEPLLISQAPKAVCIDMRSRLPMWKNFVDEKYPSPNTLSATYKLYISIHKQHPHTPKRINPSLATYLDSTKATLRGVLAAGEIAEIHESFPLFYQSFQDMPNT